MSVEYTDSAEPLARLCAIASAVEFRYAPLERPDGRRAPRSGYQPVRATALLETDSLREPASAMLEAQQLTRYMQQGEGIKCLGYLSPMMMSI